MQLPVGSALLENRYVIKSCIGDGGFGITYLATDQKLGRDVVLKEYYPDYMARRDVTVSNDVKTDAKYAEDMKAGIAKFMNEAKTLALLNNIPSIAMVHDFFEENSTGYIVMEYIRGKSLKQYIRERSVPYSFKEAMNLIRPCIYALQRVHEAGIIHRDFAPDNILINELGQAKIIDFGASRDFSSGNATMTVMVKHGYAPVEQYSHDVKQGPYTDVYSLAAVIYEMLTLKKPVTSIDRLISDKLPHPAMINGGLTPLQDEVIMKGLKPSYEERFQTVKEFLDALEMAEGMPVNVKPVNVKPVNSFEKNAFYNNLMEEPDNGYSGTEKTELVQNEEDEKNFKAPGFFMVLGILILILIVCVVLGKGLSKSSSSSKNSSSSKTSKKTASSSNTEDEETASKPKKAVDLKFVGGSYQVDGDVIVTGDDVEYAEADYFTDAMGNKEYVVALTFTEEGAKAFERGTEKYLNDFISIVLDGTVISCPMVRTVISGGKAQIAGMNSYEEAKELADALNGQ